MSFSLNEVAATARKAARGAGYEWGLADEAAMAARWLCARGLDGCAALHALLTEVDRRGIAPCRPTPGAEVWAAPDGAMCPIHAGAAMNDTAGVLAGVSETVTLRGVMAPVLFVPFAAQVSRRLATPVGLTIAGQDYHIGDLALEPVRAPSDRPADLSLAFKAPPPAPTPLHSRATPDPAVWDGLLAFAHRTYAPATEASRQKGAGGDLPDTD